MKPGVSGFLLSLAGLALVLVAGGAAPAAPAFVGHYREHAVASDHPIASTIGADVLAAGGNAADAAAATMLALGVASPASSGLGGGGFALYYRASDRTLTFLDFRETAPAASTPDMFQDRPVRPGPLGEASQYGGLASGVPGEAAGVSELVRRFGRLPLARVVEPAVRLARRGTPISSYLAALGAPFVAQLREDAGMRAWVRGEGGLVAGETLRRADLARTLTALGRKGADGFYRGPVAEAIVAANRAAGGVMTLEDLAAYRVVERSPLEAMRFGHRWVTAPPPSAGGYTLLASLAFLERVDARRELGTLPFLHALAESWKGPGLDRSAYFGDPSHVDVPLEALLSDERAAERARRFDEDAAVATSAYAMPLEEGASRAAAASGGGTSHLCVVDAEGNVAAVTTTVNLPFGARYSAAGIVMNDEMDDFARAVGEANAFGLPGGERNLPGPGRRPVSSMSPTIVFDDAGPVLCIGGSGGSRIPSAVEQVALSILRDGLTPGWAIERARVHHQGIPESLNSENFAPLSAESIAYLRALGHTHVAMDNVAVVQLVHIARDGGRTELVAASDPRKGGRPAGR